MAFDAITNQPPHPEALRDSAAPPLDGLIDVLDRHAAAPNADGLRYLEETAQQAPFRRVKRSQFHAAARVACEKMGFVQEAESLTNEYPLQIEAANDPRVAVIYAQPKPLAIRYINPQGRTVRTLIHVDALVVFTDGRAILVECKAWSVAEDKHQEGHPRFQKAPDGIRFVHAPAAEAATALGIPHIVVTESDINPTLLGNYLFLARGYRHGWTPGVGTKKLVQQLQNLGVSTTEALLEPGQAEWTADDLYGAIANGLVYVDLKSQRLGGYASVRVYATKEFADSLAAATADVTGPDRTRDTSGEQAALTAGLDLSRFPANAIDAALQRFSAIRPVLENEAAPPSLSRTQRQWYRAFLRAQSDGQVGLMGLIPRFMDRGHRGSRLDEPAEAALREALAQHADRSAQPAACHYGAYRARCKEQGIIFASKKTFYKRLKKIQSELAVIRVREGERKAYQKSPAAPLTSSAVSRMACRAWQVGIMDHTPLPMRCVRTVYGTPIEWSPWLSYLRDQKVQGILAMHVSWRHPSIETCQALLWDCLKRHKRLPESLFLDGERAHDSVAVEKFLAREGVDKIGRRYHSPRDGSTIERGFLLLQHGLLAYLQGNYVLKQDPKQWPRGWKPSQFADRTIGSLWRAIREFFTFYNAQWPQPALGGLNADEALAASLRVHGERGFRIHEDLGQARIVALPLVSRGGLRRLERQTGLRVFGQPYLPPEPIDSSFYGQDVIVRYDPSDIRYILAHVGGRWIEFRHRRAERFAGLKPDDLAALTVEFVEDARYFEKQRSKRMEAHAQNLEDIQSLPNDFLAKFFEDSEPPPVYTKLQEPDDPFRQINPENLSTLKTRSENGE